MPARLAALYDSLLSRHRLATTTASGSILAFFGDIVAQAGQIAATSDSGAAGPSTIDADRVAAFTVFGGVITGPINYLWLDALERWTRALSERRILLAKVVLQTFVLQPFIYLPTFYTTNAIVRKWSPRDAFQRARSEYLSTLTNIWLFWTPAVLYAFGRLPKRQQAVFFAGVGFAWNVILSLITNPIARRHGEALQRRLSQPHEAGSSR